MTRNEQIIALRKKGIGPREIARKMELTSSVVAGVLHRAHMTHPSDKIGGRGQSTPKEVKEEAIRIAIEVGYAAAARYAGRDPKSVRKWVERYDPS